jgi:TonB-dependent SusC/RagA subfamily outer membrane receptor
LDGFESTLSAVNDLDMDRVASITILKDAAATAIYGSKAANGVIVVETKKPEPGQLRVNYNGNFSITYADLSDYNLMNSAEKLEFEKLSGYFGELDENNNIVNESQQIKYNSTLAEIKRGVDTYWVNEPLRVAFSQSTHSSWKVATTTICCMALV